ncbi:hypothetical protein BCR39DRAFT_587489 [Naematelia encephala]|uniref:DUF6534 domain-containing protein n=1 Tax=Naematelia encephala TaxID=71784 RepID=A0A1Y2B983_9TREE|nr:hypothetical protein BCR39DRAFT_587489 [Naematelia encephala]
MSNVSDTAAAAEAAAKAHVVSNVGVTLGSYILSAWVDAVLFGVMCLQLFNWFSYKRKERLLVVCIVYCAGFFSTVMTVFLLVMTMHHFVYNFGTYLPFNSVQWIGWPPLLEGIISSACQCFYIDRAYRLNNNNILIPIGIGTLVFVSLGAAIGTRVDFGLLKAESQAANIDIFVYVWLSCTMSADILITLLVGYGLHKNRTGWTETDRLVKRLILLAFETQLPPALVSIAFIIEFAINPPSSLGVFMEVLLSKTYIVALLVVLNSRYNLRRQLGNRNDEWGDGQKRTNTYALGSARPAQATVHITTDTYTESFQVPAQRIGRNRDPAFDIKEEPEILEESEREQESLNLEDDVNHSKTGLTDAASRV